jgi:hypothetical protein
MLFCNVKYLIFQIRKEENTGYYQIAEQSLYKSDFITLLTPVIVEVPL